MNIITQVHTALDQYLQASFGYTGPYLFTLNVDENRQGFGDISANPALLLAKSLKRKPLDIAQEIAQGFTHPALAKIEIAGPGFLNFYVTPHTFQSLATELLIRKADFFKPDIKSAPHKICIEFVSANPTGPLHFGHGRGAIIGDVLTTVLRFIGQSADAEFYINDAGAQIVKLGNSLKIRCEQVAGHDSALPEDAYHGEYLVELARECIARHGTQVLSQSDTFFQEYAKTKLLARIRTTLSNFGISFDTWFSEKTLHEQGLITHALEKLHTRGYLYEQEGALWFASTRFGDDKDRVVRKASGELTYVAADIAYMQNKIDRGYTKLIMILGHDHHSYVTRLHTVQQALGLTQYPLDIILYQLVKMKEDGQQVRMSKRAGNIITLDDVIETVGTDVARFFYLNKKADAQLEFDIELALKHTDENPVYYIQYAYVRTLSVLQKAAEHESLAHIAAQDAVHLSAHEGLLIKKIISLQTVLTDISSNYQTYLLAQFALELSTLFHQYYSTTRVINTDDINTSRARLLLITLVRNTLETILELLKISRPVRM
jgi:arginyl-tRNA synthetase